MDEDPKFIKIKIKRGFDKYMRYALKLIRRSSYYQRCKHGAVIVKGGSIIATGTNTLKYYNPQLDILTSVHAEVAAIKKVKNLDKLKGAKMYVARLAFLGPAQSCPCKNCKEAIIESGIKTIFYTTKSGWEKLKINY